MKKYYHSVNAHGGYRVVYWIVFWRLKHFIILTHYKTICFLIIQRKRKSFFWDNYHHEERGFHFVPSGPLTEVALSLGCVTLVGYIWGVVCSLQYFCLFAVRHCVLLLSPCLLVPCALPSNLLRPGKELIKSVRTPTKMGIRGNTEGFLTGEFKTLFPHHHLVFNGVLGSWDLRK